MLPEDDAEAPKYVGAFVIQLYIYIYIYIYIQGDQKVSVHLMITIQKITSNVQSAPRQSPDIY